MDPQDLDTGVFTAEDVEKIAAFKVCLIEKEIVIGPTPPGTGVYADTRSALLFLLSLFSSIANMSVS